MLIVVKKVLKLVVKIVEFLVVWEVINDVKLKLMVVMNEIKVSNEVVLV